MYQENKSYNVIKGTIPEFSTSDVTIAYTINNERSKEAFPVKEDGYEVNKVTCNDEVEAEWDQENWSLKITGNKKHVNKIKCNIDFSVTLSNYLIAKSAYDESIVKEEHGATSQTNATIDYRYIGADPNNYVCLESNEECTDEELYRIIGVMPTQKDEIGQYENRIKLISNTSYGKYYWMGNKDSTTVDWTTSTLNTEILNKTYWESIKEYQQYIESAKWYLGKSIWNGNAKSNYEMERILGESGGFMVANIGLMYTSDFSYATSGNDFDSRHACLERINYRWGDEFSYCNQNDWIYYLCDESMHTITGGYNTIWSTQKEFFSETNGFTIGGLNTASLQTQYETYPTFYLKASVQYLKGTGEKTNPYRIMINE